VEWNCEKWIESNRVSVSPYVPASGSEEEENPASIAASEKNRKHGCTHGDNMENVKSFFSKYKNSTHNDKNWEDSSHQASTYFSFHNFCPQIFVTINS
jgi:hypothetical protein